MPEKTTVNACVCVVIPVYNEAPFIETVIKTVPAWVRHIIAVDDASTDGTHLRLAALESNPRLTVLRHQRNQGVGAAIVTGYRKALELSCDVIAVMGGDGQMAPSDLVTVVSPVAEGRADYVKGNRFLHRQSLRVMPPLRRAGNRFFSYLTRWASGKNDLFDSQCGYTAVSADLLRRLDLDNLYRRYGFPNDILIKVLAAGGRVMDVPVRSIYGRETSGIGFFTSVPRMLLLVIALGVRYRLAAPYRRRKNIPEPAAEMDTRRVSGLP